jgi:hypothetical protein
VGGGVEAIEVQHPFARHDSYTRERDRRLHHWFR